MLVIGSTRATARRLRERAEALLEGPSRSSGSAAGTTLGERLLREHAEAAGLDPFFDVLGPAERLAMLLDRLDAAAAAPPRDPRQPGRAAGPPAGADRRAEGRAGRRRPASRSGSGRARRAASDEADREAARRELEFAELYTAHDRILAEAGSLDRGDVFLALDCLFAERPDVRRGRSPRASST